MSVEAVEDLLGRLRQKRIVVQRVRLDGDAVELDGVFDLELAKEAQPEPPKPSAGRENVEDSLASQFGMPRRPGSEDEEPFGVAVPDDGDER